MVHFGSCEIRKLVDKLNEIGLLQAQKTALCRQRKVAIQLGTKTLVSRVTDGFQPIQGFTSMIRQLAHLNFVTNDLDKIIDF
jgi:hypothetical protein